MGQVPQNKYCIIGSGRLAKHLSHYFNLLDIKHQQWSRQSGLDLSNTVKENSHILLAISDDSIKDFISGNKEIFGDKVLVHFSGAKNIEGIFSTHPLMSFSNELYALETYKKISFVCGENTDFKTLFPFLENGHYNMKNSAKSYYHSLITMAGNFPQILWTQIKKDLGSQLDLPPDIINGYLAQVTINQITNPESCLTGPLVREDKETIDAHKQVLSDSSYANLYNSFLSFYSGSYSGGANEAS